LVARRPFNTSGHRVPYLKGQAKLNQDRVVQEILKHRDFSNLVMVTHDLNISDVVLEDTVSMGEFFVVQPRGATFDVIGRIRLND
jgi:hypothetical protein